MTHPTPSDPLFPLVLRPRHRWFSAPSLDCEDGWYGPHKTAMAAAAELVANLHGEDDLRIFVAQGYRMTKAEREECCGDFDWAVDPATAIEIVLPPSPR
jgi:hypothetical protein